MNRHGTIGLAALVTAALLTVTTPPAHAEGRPASQPAAAEPSHVLPPTAAPKIRKALGMVGGAHADGLTLSASIDKATIRVKGSKETADGVAPVLHVTLVHAAAAPEGTWSAAGVALVETPGPNDPAALAALKARLGAAPAPIPWTARKAKRPDPAVSDEVHGSLDRARYLIAAGDIAEARKLLDGLPTRLEPGVALRLAVLWHKSGDKARAAAVLDRLGEQTGAEAAIIALIRDPAGSWPKPLTALGDVSGAEACRFTEFAAFLSKLGRAPDGLVVAQRVLELAPDCRAAWESGLHRNLEAQQFEDAIALADKAVARFPDDDAIAAVAASAYQARGQYRKATPLLLGVARRNPRDEGIVRVLLSAILRDTDYRQTYKDQLVQWREKDPEDKLAQFLLGVVHHYENAFERSTELLLPLEESMGHQSRLHIYLAMNDFNLGRRDAALRRLNAAAERPIPDPDIFYCRAEITRDTDRAQALEDLLRYQTGPEGGYMANPPKEARVSRMIADLRACLEDGRAVCDSEWEHPRLRHHEPDEAARARKEADEAAGLTPVQWAVGGALGLLLILGGALLARRPKKAA